MKKTLLVLIPIVVLTLNSCVSMNKGHGYDIKQNTGTYAYGSTSIEYKDYDYLLNEKVTKLKNRMASSGEIQAASASIPKGGIAIVTIERGTIGAANTKYFEYVAYQDGKEILRQKGDDNIAQVPSTAGGRWWNLDIVSFPRPITSDVTLYVIDTLMGNRDSFTISKPKK